MQRVAEEKLSRYLVAKGIQFDRYIDLSCTPPEVKNNYDVVPLMHSTPIVHRTGEPFNPIGGRRRRQRAKSEALKLRPYRRTYRQQLEHAFRLVDANFILLEGHARFLQSKNIAERPVQPDFPVECRDASKFECGNWSRFVQIWLIYLAALRPETFCGTDHIIDLDINGKAKTYSEATTAEVALTAYRKRVYGIIHSGKRIVFFYPDSEFLVSRI